MAEALISKEGFRRMTPMTVSEVAAFLRRSVKSVKRLPIPFSRVGKGGPLRVQQKERTQDFRSRINQGRHQ